MSLDLDEHRPPLAAVRRWISEALTGLDDEELGDVLLAATELVSNAYDHGQHPRQLRLRHLRDPRLVRIEVDDAAPEQPVLGRSRLRDTRGRGLIIVNNLAAGWDVARHAIGKTVWADVACEASCLSDHVALNVRAIIGAADAARPEHHDLATNGGEATGRFSSADATAPSS